MAWDPEDADYESLADLQRLAPLFSTKIRALKMGSWRGPIVQDCLADLLLDAKVLW